MFLFLELQHQVIRKLNALNFKVNQMSSDVLNMMEILNKRVADTQQDLEEENKQNVLFDFPIISEEDMHQFEKQLEDKENFKLLVSILLAFQIYF